VNSKSKCVTIPPGKYPPTWGWQYSERARSYYWARWEARLEDSRRVGLPQNNWAAEEWAVETGRIIKFWMDTRHRWCSLYQKGYNNYEPAKRHIARATLAAIGGMIVYTRGRNTPVGPDAEEMWILKTKYAHPALHNLGTQLKLPTNADDKYYALLRTSRDQRERMVVVLNYQATPQTVEVDLVGVALAGLLDVRDGSFIEHRKVQVELPAYGYRFFQLVPAASCTP
jgi:hypothetical protein